MLVYFAHDFPPAIFAVRVAVNQSGKERRGEKIKTIERNEMNLSAATRNSSCNENGENRNMKHMLNRVVYGEST